MDEPAAGLSETSEFLVELGVYSGPFRLLAEMVLTDKLDVCDVPVARVTERFVGEGVEAVGRWSLEEATSFLSICSALLELKVGRLLPRSRGPSVDEDLVQATSPDLLFARTLELGAFRRAADVLSDLMTEAALMVGRSSGPPADLVHLYPDPLEKVSPETLRSVAVMVLAPPPKIDLSHVAPIRASVADALEDVRSRLSQTERACFADLVVDCRERIDVVVRFLALLELHREGEVELSQGELFGDIEVRWHAEAASSSGDRERARSVRKGQRW